MPLQWNGSSLIDHLEKELGTESTLYWLFISIFAAMIWIVYLTYYNSRVIGLLLTVIINRVVKYGHIKIGSFSVSVLSGKVMFRDLHVITEDFSLRVQLGFAIFRWWRPLIQKGLNEDLSHSETRLSIYFDTFELHMYNRSSLYAKLEEMFGLDQQIIPPKDEKDKPDGGQDKNQTQQNNKPKWQWRDLIPVVKFEISTGKLVFGNYLLPTTLSINFRDAHIVYTTKPASTPFDQFMHIMKCRADNLRVMLVPSPKYTGPSLEQPPRLMGEGYVVLLSNNVDLYYYQDEAGLVPYEPELVQLANGDVIARRTWPCMGVDVKCGKGTDISYGPWADRRREELWKFFFPQDYQPLEITEIPEPGQRRIQRTFDFKMSMQYDSTLDILFTKNKETQAVHLNTRPGTYVEVTIPWIVEESGYISKINGQLMHVDATTSLAFRSFLEAETLEFEIDMQYPRNWNDHQDYKFDFIFSKASVHFIFHHKIFFTDLIEDWSSKTIPDIFHFVPYTYRINVLMRKFELITLANEHNWIDCFGQTPENAHIAFTGETFDMSFNLTFIDYLPPVVPIKFFIRGESVDCLLFLPETNTSRHILLSLAAHNKIMSRDGTILDMPFVGNMDKWRSKTQKSLGWIDCWTTPIVALSIGYTYHPIPPVGDDPLRPLEEPVSTPDAEEQLLIPLRLVPLHPRPRKFQDIDTANFDPTQIEADLISLELEIGPSVLCVYGSLLGNFLHVKENYFGEDQAFKDLQEGFSTKEKATSVTSLLLNESKEKKFDPRQYRPLHVKVQVTLHDIQAHLIKNCNDDGPPCPCIYLERLGFEMDKRYQETKLQVLISPAILVAKDDIERPLQHNELKDGHLALSGLQVRGHALFSHEGLPLDNETLEYAWMVEVTVGDITGRLTVPQLQSVVESLQTFVFLVEDSENTLQRREPFRSKICQHGVNQASCTAEPKYSFLCPTEEEVKYRLTRASVDCIDLYLVEAGTALNLQVYPIRVSTCNLHGKNNKAGVTALVPHFNIKQFIYALPPNQEIEPKSPQDIWLEAGGFSFGPLTVDAAMALPSPEFHVIQGSFLKLHDKSTHRLWFLWPPDLSQISSKVIGKCGCLGGCTYFGKNRNGPKFFTPTDQDFVDSYSTAVFNIITQGTDFGYGQSLLQTDQLVFDIQSTAMPTSPTKTKLMNKRGFRTSRSSVDTSTGTTLVDDNASHRQSSLLSYISDRSIDRAATKPAEMSFSGSDHTVVALSRTEETDETRTSSVDTGSLPSDYVPEGPVDVFDTDHLISSPSETMTWGSGGTGSVTSLPEASGTVRKPYGHERKLSYDAMKKHQYNRMSENGQSPLIGSPTSHATHGSKSSIPSSGGYEFKSISRQSSLTSPVLRRLSSQFSVHNEGSLASMSTGSERFFSAYEDVTSGEDLSSPPYRTLSSTHSDANSSSLTSVDSPTGLMQTATLLEGDSSSSESVTSFVSARTSPSQSQRDLTKIPSQPDLLKDVKAAGVLDDDQQTSTTIDGDDMGTNTTFDHEELEDMDMSRTEATINYVDLHGQINQQITRSPLLMSCYNNHMNQLQCSHWSTRIDPAYSSKISSANGEQAPAPAPVWIPQFAYKKDGFSPGLMVDKREFKPVIMSFPSTASEKSQKNVFGGKLEEESSSSVSTSDGEEDETEEEQLGFTYEDHVSKTTAVVKLKGSVDIMVSPLMLESLQRFVESLTPAMANMHPSAIVDALHFQCSSSVISQHKLKKKESKNECPDKAQDKGGHGHRGETSPTSVASEAKSRTSRMQVMFSLARINISILQVSLVEEIIDFSVLERARELTCVSVLAACIDDISLQVLTNSYAQKSEEVQSDASPDSINKRLPGMDGGRGDKKIQDVYYEETDQCAETLEEDTVGILKVGRVHFQLRRMKKDFNDAVSLTAIPEYKSKVLFTFARHSYHQEHQGSPSRMSVADNVIHEELEADDIAGFIMFECGLEDINIKAAKRSGYKGQVTSEEDDALQQADKNLNDAQSKISSEKPKFGLHDAKESDVGSVEGSQQSERGNSADDEASSWQSRVSVESEGNGEVPEPPAAQDLHGDASSCSIGFKEIWFNFAAPPVSSNKRKLVYTRFDWNLLSTVSPAINAWMQPGHRMIQAGKTLMGQRRDRMNTVMACMMTEGLDTRGIHMPHKSKYGKITSLSRILQEDPSCQLFTVLRRYIKQVGINVIEDNLNVDTVPQLITIQKGLLALTRQWKNILYMPLLVDTSFKNKKRVHPYTVAFTIPKEESIDHFNMDDGEATLDNFEVVDEKTSLLKAEGGSVHHGSLISLAESNPQPAQLDRHASAMQLDQNASPEPQPISANLSSESIRKTSGNALKGGQSKMNNNANIARMSPQFGSVDSPARLTSASQRSQSFALQGAPSGSAILNVPKMQRNESNMSFVSASMSASSDHGLVSVPGTPLKQSLTKQLSELDKREDEDLYRWMQRQQEYTKFCPQPGLNIYPSLGHDSFINTGISEYSQDDNISMQRLAIAPFLHLADARILFRPLLKGLGVHLGAVKSSAFMKKFGGNVSIQGTLKKLRVLIVDSESQANSKAKNKGGRGRIKRLPKLQLEVGLEPAAFQCDMFSVMISMKDVVDFEKEKQDAVMAHDLRRRSLRAIKFAMEHMEAKPTTTKVYFSMNCDSIQPHVNMSLLRLTHQFISMVENINETRVELSGKSDNFKTHRKQDSKGSSTGTESQSVDATEPAKVEPMPLESLDTPTPDSSGLEPAPKLPIVDEHRPDKLPLFTPSTKSPSKKFSLKRSIGRFQESLEKQTSSVTSPLHPFNVSDQVAIEMTDTSSPVLAEKTIMDEIKENTPKCWRTLYHLLELYSTMPETKTLERRPSASRLSVIDEEPEKVSQTQSIAQGSSTYVNKVNVEELERQPAGTLPQQPPPMRPHVGTFTQSVFIRDQIPLVVFGSGKVRRINITAMLSGLKLEAEVLNVHASATHRERIKAVLKRKSQESSATVHVGRAMIELREGLPPNTQTVVTINVAKSQGLYSSMMRRSKEHNSALVTIGNIMVDIPQHPVVLHGMVARSSRRLSSTLQEFWRPPTKVRSFDNVDSGLPSQQPSKHSDLNEYMTGPGGTSAAGLAADQLGKKAEEKSTPKSLIIHFKAFLQGLTIGASLLPSLKAQYKMGKVSSSGVTGKKARFNVNLPNHSLSFSSKFMFIDDLKRVDDNVFPEPTHSQTPATDPLLSETPRRVVMRRKRADSDPSVSTPSTLPSSASIDLPPIHIHADYRPYTADTLNTDGGLTEGLVLREGSYLNAVAEVGAFEHSLTTDLLNHLVFVQKVFMKEVNEVVQKVSGADQPVPLWEEGLAGPKETGMPLLYSLQFQLKRIQITATTPTSCAVRLETGSIELEVSNRVQTASKDGTSQANKHAQPKVFLKAQVDLNLALGLLLKNPLYEEMEAEFQNLASFTTRIALRNALQDEMIPGVSRDQEALLISLKRPVVFIQPAAFDKAVLVWLNYKNAYEYWNEQRLALNKEVQTATQQVIDKLPLGSITQTNVQSFGTLFLQLTVDDLGICLPLSPFGQTSNTMKIIDDGGAALVLTLVSTQISACSCGSLVSKGRFTGFCLRFADDFEVSWDDWKPDETLQYVMNAMVVPEGTYEVCSQTSNAQPNDPSSNPKWFLNITWQMKGLDVHLDHNIGKRLSALGTTLTSFTGDQPEEEDYKILEESEEETESELPTIKVDGPNRKLTTLPEGLPEMAYDASLDAKTRARIIEKEMNEQAKIVQDLKQLGASQNTIAAEEKKLTELQSAVFNDFRQEILKRLKRQSVKATAIKDKLGLGLKPTHVRSKSSDTASGLALLPGPGKKKERRAVSSYVDHPGIDPTTVQFDIKDGTERLHEDEEGFFVNGEDAHKLPGRHGVFMRPSMQDVPESSSDSEGEDPDLAILRKSGRRQRGGSNQRVPSPSTGSLSSQKAALSGLEPNVDFEADIHVEIDTGQCVLHPKERVDLDTDAKTGKGSAKKESRDYMSSPHSGRKAKKKSSLEQVGPGSATKYGRLQLSQQQPQIDNTTVFFMPGVDVRVHYDSKTSATATTESPTSTKPDLDSTTPSFATPDTQDSTTTTGRKGASKKANMYAWLSLQKLSEEMLISPVLLDFLEQALEPIPMIQLIQSSKNSKSTNSTYDQDELDASANSLVSTTSNVYASFPVDVVVYIRVQASLVRFTCLPVSRVECLLRLPSLDLVFSTKRADADGNFLPDTSPPPKNKSGTTKPGLSSRDSASKFTTRPRTASGIGIGSTTQTDASVGGGLSVTGSLTDFSLYIFHPYGHGHKKTTLSALENSFRRGKHLDDSLGNTIQDPSTRKDSLSLNVEFVKVNISRSRRGVLQSETRTVSDTKAANIVRFSAVCDIGSASFKYDMRRLSEILALPKAWYRRSLARRMFLGEENVMNVFDESEEDDLLGVSSSSPGTPDNPRLSFSRAQTMSTLHTSHLENDKPSHRRVASEDRNVSLNLDFKRELDDLNPSRSHSGTGTGTGSGSSPQSPSDEKFQIPSAHTSRIHSAPSSRQSVGSPNMSSRLRDLENLAKKSSPFTTPVVPGKANRDWETLVLFAVNLARLDVAVNMSNVMGNTVWQTQNLKSQGRLSIDSTGYKDMKISANVSGSKLEARGGIVGGHIELHELYSYVSVNEEPDHEPDHSAGVQFFVLETKLDYMGSSVLMGRISEFNTVLRDEWRLDINQLQKSAPLATKRPAVVFVHGDMGWDCFHLLISRSTTPDIIKMVAKLDEFFTQQLNSSKRALSAFGPIAGSRRPPQRRKSSIDEAAWISEIRHHRHWQKVLELVSGCKLSMLQNALPEQATILGGTMSLHGNNLSLACYHGINFRSKSWALFTMNEPIITFATEAQDVTEQDGKSTHIVQNLSFQLGHNMAEKRHERHMATILKVSRGHYMPPPFTSVSDWFHYAFASTETKDLENFPQVTPMGSESPLERPRLSSRKTDYNHDTEIIFELPSLEMHLKTEHLQSENEPTENDPKPVVVCSFVTQFEDHIMVAMDAEVIFFLHDLVTNYVKEKDRGARSSFSKSPQSPDMERKNLTDPTTVLKQDYREFDCKTWHLEPTVRLISWAGKRIDPVGVDYILQKLGFQHARLTIPKWMQRGAMDPLDMILSVLVKKLIHLLKEVDEKETKLLP